MDDQQYRAELDALKYRLVEAMGATNVGIAVPVFMEMVLSAILSIDDKAEALRATASLRPMIDYIESQLRGQH